MIHKLISDIYSGWLRPGFDKHSPWKPRDNGKPGEQTTAKATSTLPRKAGVYCARCRAFLTGNDQAMERSGAHRHHFVNPAGIEYEIALFQQVACHRHGTLTLEHTWFSGYHWQIALCVSCHEHLGWCFQRPDSPVFYGLITERIIQT